MKRCLCRAVYRLLSIAEGVAWSIAGKTLKARLWWGRRTHQPEEIDAP
jgi:hypothetical protein